MERGAWQAIYSPWGCKESDTTEYFHFHFLLEVMKLDAMIFFFFFFLMRILRSASSLLFHPHHEDI